MGWWWLKSGDAIIEPEFIGLVEGVTAEAEAPSRFGVWVTEVRKTRKFIGDLS